MQVGIATGEELDGFGGLERGDEIDDRAQHANRVAGFLETLAAAIGGEQAREAWRQTRANGHSEPVAGDGGGVNPGLAGFDGEFVDQKPRLEIVGAVENYVETREQLPDVARVHIRYDAFHGYAGIEGPQFALGRHGLGERVAGVGFIEKSLALQVRRLDEIAIDDANAADAGTHEQIGRRRADRAAAHDDGTGRHQALLSLLAKTSEQDLPGIFFAEQVVHR